jgi:hypothetical protein
MSPPANTPGKPVIIVLQSMATVPQRLTLSAGSPNSTGKSSGSKPSALITRSASTRNAEAHAMGADRFDPGSP